MTDPAVLYRRKVSLMNDYLMIATVLKPQGVRGECKLRSYAADIELFHRWHTLYRREAAGYEPVSVRIARIRDGFVYAFLDGSDSAEAAEAFRGTDLYVDRAHAAPLEEGAVLIADLIGCVASDERGETVGTLCDVRQHGPVDTWVFRTKEGSLMAPALKSVFPDVDPEKGVISVIREKLEEVAVRDSIS